MNIADRGLSEEQRVMRDSCRAFVDDFVTPFIRKNWQREWLMDPDQRLPREILEAADRIGIRRPGVPEEFGGVRLDSASEVQTFAIISDEIGRGDSGFADKLVQNYVQGGSILIKHQAVASRLAEMATKLCAVRALLREASVEVDISKLKIVKAMFPRTAGAYAGPGG